MRARLLVLLLILTLTPRLFSQDVIGEVVYVEGNPEIYRDGELLFATVDFGFQIQNFDSIQTRDDESVEVAIDPATGIDATLAVAPGTEFSFDMSSLLTEQVAVVDMVAGSIHVIARRLTGMSELQIRMPTAAMGVRGTTFTVTTAEGGELLVSTDEGIVEVTDASGLSLFAVPGDAVEVDPSRRLFRNLRHNAGEVEGFRGRWRRERRDAVVARLPELLLFYGQRYIDTRAEFIQSYTNLMRRRRIIDRWIDQGRRGIAPGDRALSLADRETVMEDLRNARASMERLEYLYSWLSRIVPFLAEVDPDLEIGEGRTLAALRRLMANDRVVMRERIVTVRQVLKLYAARNQGGAPRVPLRGL